MRLFKQQHNDFLPSSRSRYVIALLVVLVFFAFFPLITSANYDLYLVTIMLVFAIVSLSIDLMGGFMGLASLGQAMYFGFGAYCVTYMTTTLNWGHEIAILISLGMIFLFSAIVAILLKNAWGTTFLIVNIALSQMIWGLAYRWVKVTNGDNGLNVARPTLFNISFQDPVMMYYMTFVVFCIIVFIMYRIVNSPFGLTIHGVRQSRKRMSAVGFNVYVNKFICCVISGCFTGIAGILYAYTTKFVSTDNLVVQLSSKALLMLVVGGGQTFIGAIIGAISVVGIEKIVSGYTNRWNLILGLFFVVIITLSPRGVMGIYEDIKKKFRR